MTLQEKKEKRLKFEKAKKQFFKWLHILCYILSALFILICVIGGVKGCSSKKSSNNTISQPNNSVNVSSNSYYYQLYFTTGQVDLSYDLQTDLLSDYIDLSITYDTQPNNYIIEIPVNFNVYDYEFNSINIDTIRYTLWPYRFSDNLWRYMIFKADLINYADIYNFIDKSYTAYYDYTYDLYYFEGEWYSFLFSNELINDKLFNYLFIQKETSNFIFNNNFNYNAPMGISLDSPYGNGAIWTSSTQYTAHIDYNVGYFVSNGMIFDTIQYWCTSAQDSDFIIQSGVSTSTITTGASGSWAYIWIYYVNSVTNTTVLANYRNQVAYIKNSTTNAYYYDNSSTWQNDDYRYITFLDLSTDLKIKIQAFNNNNQSYYGGNIYTGGGDVFTLLSNAFVSLTGFLSINLLPGISIGVLFFLPLIVGIIVILFKIFKK